MSERYISKPLLEPNREAAGGFAKQPEKIKPASTVIPVGGGLRPLIAQPVLSVDQQIKQVVNHEEKSNHIRFHEN